MEQHIPETFDLDAALANEAPLSPPQKKKTGLVIWIAFGLLAGIILYAGFAADRNKKNDGPPTLGEGTDEFVPGSMRRAPPAPMPKEEKVQPAAPVPAPAPPHNAPQQKGMTDAEKLAYLRQRAPIMVDGGGEEREDRQPVKMATSQHSDPYIRDEYGAVVGLRDTLAGAPGEEPQVEKSSDEAFWEKAKQTTVIRVKATPPQNLEHVVSEGKLIDAVLETAVNSDLPGKVRAMIDEDVYGDQGHTILLPRMTRLIGEYNSKVRNGQTRVFVIWTRAIRPDGASISLGSPGTDSVGRSGLAGEVDKHWFERFGTAIFLSIVGSAGQAAVSQGSDAAAAYYRLEISRNIAQTANEALRYNLRIPPTIHIDQGTRVKVFVAQDLDFRDAMRQAAPE
jgi:type IV secretion system protein VirB10